MSTNKDDTLHKVLHKKVVASITPFTTLDFKDHLSCILWFGGCNMRCPYCYNPRIVLDSPQITIQEVFDFLQKRVGRLDGVVFSGGEATLCKELLLMAMQIKKMGFKIKLDTNGSNPMIVSSLLQRELVDFVSLDMKATKEKYFAVTQSHFFDKFEQTLKLLQKSDCDFEVRTTYHSSLFDIQELHEMAQYLQNVGYKNTYFIQNFLCGCEYLGSISQEHTPLKNFSTVLSTQIRNT